LPRSCDTGIRLAGVPHLAPRRLRYRVGSNENTGVRVAVSRNLQSLDMKPILHDAENSDPLLPGARARQLLIIRYLSRRAKACTRITPPRILRTMIMLLLNPRGERYAGAGFA
jgi:hypothetical protein